MQNKIQFSTCPAIEALSCSEIDYISGGRCWCKCCIFTDEGNE